jgi:hypothetical protein
MSVADVLSKRERRALVLGALTVGAIIVGARLVPLVADQLQFERAAAEIAVRQVAVDRALIDGATELAAHASDARVVLESARAPLLAAASPTAAGASLAALLGRMASAERVQLASSLMRGDTSFVGGYAQVSVRAYATADVHGLLRWIERIEMDPRGLAVRELVVTQPDPAADERAPEALRVEVLIEALVRQELHSEVAR